MCVTVKFEPQAEQAVFSLSSTTIIRSLSSSMPAVTDVRRNLRSRPYVAWAIFLAAAAMAASVVSPGRAESSFDGLYNGTYGLSGTFNDPGCAITNNGKITVSVIGNRLQPTLSYAPFSIDVPSSGKFTASSVRHDKGWTIQLTGQVVDRKMELEWRSPYCHFHASLERPTLMKTGSTLGIPQPAAHSTSAPAPPKAAVRAAPAGPDTTATSRGIANAASSGSPSSEPTPKLNESTPSCSNETSFSIKTSFERANSGDLISGAISPPMIGGFEVENISNSMSVGSSTSGGVICQVTVTTNRGTYFGTWNATSAEEKSFIVYSTKSIDQATDAVKLEFSSPSPSPSATALAASSTSPLPPEIKQVMSDASKECGGPTQSDFITLLEIVGLKSPAYIFDYGKACTSHRSGWCGSGGCLLSVYATINGSTYSEVLHTLTRAYQFRNADDRTYTDLTLSGIGCGKMNAENCPVTLQFDGRRFVEQPSAPGSNAVENDVTEAGIQEEAARAIREEQAKGPPHLCGDYLQVMMQPPPRPGAEKFTSAVALGWLEYLKSLAPSVRHAAAAKLAKVDTEEMLTSVLVFCLPKADRPVSDAAKASALVWTIHEVDPSLPPFDPK